MTVKSPGEIQLEEHHLNCAAGSTRKADNLIDGYGRRTEQLLNDIQSAGVPVEPFRLS